MKGRHPRTAGLPVDPERLRQEFPSLTSEELEAYATVTRRILACEPGERARLTRSILAQGREALARHAERLDAEQSLAARYVRALEAMQGRVGRPGR